VSQDLSQTEQEIVQRLSAGDLEAAAVLTLRSYGSEIFGFLIAQLREQQHAEDVFSSFAEDLWRSLPGLTLQTSMRAYAYALARNAKHRFLQRDLRKQRAAQPLSEHGLLSQLVAEARTGTAPYIATRNKSKLSALRDRLTPDEQALLTLRVDRGLEWREIAEVFGETTNLTRAAAQKRKRFQLIKDKLAAWAREEGLLADEP
jgi:RNA polymerase sigma-70 factor, ECF subfamily